MISTYKRAGDEPTCKSSQYDGNYKRDGDEPTCKSSQYDEPTCKSSQYDGNYEWAGDETQRVCEGAGQGLGADPQEGGQLGQGEGGSAVAPQQVQHGVHQLQGRACAVASGAADQALEPDLGIRSFTLHSLLKIALLIGAVSQDFLSFFYLMNQSYLGP